MIYKQNWNYEKGLWIWLVKFNLVLMLAYFSSICCHFIFAKFQPIPLIWCWFNLYWFHQTDKDSCDRINTCSTLSVSSHQSAPDTTHWRWHWCETTHITTFEGTTPLKHNLKAASLGVRMLSRSVVLIQLTSQGRNIKPHYIVNLMMEKWKCISK